MTATIELRGLTKRLARRSPSTISQRVSDRALLRLSRSERRREDDDAAVLLGLVAPTAGTATIDGKRYCKLAEPVREVGALLEASGFHPGRTAIDHLRGLAVAARLPTDASMRALAEVGLASDAKRKVSAFSLGMRQRLGLAAAILGEPRVLVLDEPSNGLDPQGIRWLRGYLRELADNGRTVFVSSHVLAEVEQIADKVLMIANGRVVRSSGLAELRAEAGVLTGVRSPEIDRLRALLEAAGYGVRGSLRTSWSSTVVPKLSASSPPRTR